MTKHDEYKRAFMEDFAAAWRAIGQPDPDRFFLLVAVDTPEFDYLPQDYLGLTMVEVSSLPYGRHLMLGFKYDDFDSRLSLRFNEEWDKIREKYAHENPFTH